MLPALFFASLLDSNPAPTRPTAPLAIPGDRVEVFERQRKGLQRTGGIIDPHLPRGYSYRIFENHIGKEFRYGKTLLPCDPTDQSGYAYLPKTLLVVLKKPSGLQYVVGDRQAFLVRSEAEVQTKLQGEESFLAQHQGPPKDWRQRLGGWWHHSVLQEPYMTVAFDDGHEQIYRGVAQNGALGELVLVPILDPGYNGDPKTASTTPAPIPGAMKVVRYLTRYEQPALGDLVMFARRKH